MIRGVFWAAIIFILTFLSLAGIVSSAYAECSPAHPALHSNRDLQAVLTNNPMTPDYVEYHSPIINSATPQGFSPQDLKKIYQIPDTGDTGSIGIIDAYNDPSIESDLATYSQQFNLPSCTVANGCLTIVYQSGATPPPNNTSWISETSLDTQMAHAVAPHAKIILYLVNSTMDKDLAGAILPLRAMPGVRAVSMSWGGKESSTVVQADQALAGCTNVGLFASTGDKGFSGGVQWPAVASNVTAVGGTSVSFNGSTATQKAWTGSGGGISAYVPEPTYQTNSVVSVSNNQGKRAIPDISALADPQTGVAIVVNGAWKIYGGTSASAPIVAAMSLYSASDQRSTSNYYDRANTKYAQFFTDITQGTNGSCGAVCTAKQGFDEITGLGTPIGSAFAIAPSGTTPTIGISPTVGPTIGIPTPTTPAATTNTLTFTALLHGIGKGGDNASPTTINTTIPKHLTRTISTTMYNGQNQQVTTATSIGTYDTILGGYQTTVSIPTTPNGAYIVNIGTLGFLHQNIPGIIMINPGSNIISQTVHLVTGDINGDNKVDINDYNMIINCFGSKFTSPSCGSLQSADLNDDGVVDGSDYNLFLRELLVQFGN